MSNALATPSDRTANVMQAVADELAQRKGTLAHLLPKEITPERMRALVLTSIRKTPALMKCTPKSIIGCVYEAAKLGLAPDTATADCHIIPRKGEATFQIGYKGLMKLVRRAAPMVAIKAEHVRSCDHFVWSEGLNPTLEHKRAPAGQRKESEITHAYAIAEFADGRRVFKVVDADDIERAKKSAHMTAYSPWRHHEGSMWEKTAIKRLAKTLPIDDPSNNASDRLFRAIDLDDAATDGRPQSAGAELEIGDVTPHGEGHDDGEIIEIYQCTACGTTNDEDHAEGCPESPR